MKKTLNNKLLLIVLFILIIVGCCILHFEYGNTGTINSLYINDGSIMKSENNSDFSYDNSTLNEVINKNDDLDSYISNDAHNIDINVSGKNNNGDIDENNVSYTENDVVNYFEGINDEISDSESFKDKFKEYFVIIVDFIFYDKDIKGYTFKELSNTAKIKVISFALKIDAKLEEYLPNYKENISSVSGNIYNNIKEKLVYLYMDISTNICKDNEEECNNVKIIWDDIKDVCGIGWEFIKNIALDSIEKLKDWYEIYSGKR